MRRDSLRSLGGTVVATLLYAATVAAAEANLPGPDGTAKQLVDAALASELNGPSDLRPALLKQALERDPNFAPARWQSGYVRYENQWLTLDEVAKRVAGDQQLAEYRKRRDALIDRADDHRALAQWCHKQKLADLERIHWAKVLEFNAQDAEAIAGLGLQLFEGRLLTPKQIEAARQRAIEGRQALKRWQPQMVKWRKAISAGRGPECTAALEALDKLNDPDAIPALEATFAENVASKKNDEMNLLLIATVGRMHFPEATEVLLRRALVPDSQQVREAAADELKKRPLFAYVPQLIALLPGSLTTKFHVYILPDGMVLHEHEVFVEGRAANISMTYESVVNPGDLPAAMRATPAAFRGEANRAKAIEFRAQAAQTQLDWLRARVEFALQRTTGFANVNDQAFWEKQYNDYNGWYSPKSEKPTYAFASRSVQGTTSVPMTSAHVISSGHSCFPAGTQIVTDFGSKPIEQLKIGDRVLSQGVESGELTYKPIQGTTLRQPVPLLKIDLESSSIWMTPGHPVWVIGKGWQTAKNLSVGDCLHGLEGAAVVHKIDNVRPSEVYNLVVSDSHNYFVGDKGILVHDNSPLLESSALVPGLSIRVEAP